MDQLAATATEAGRIGSAVAGKYRLERVLGRGGMGIVYRAQHLVTRRQVAIKIMHPESQLQEENVKRFLNEGANAGRVKHANVVEFIEMGQDPADGSLFIVLELLRGTDLATYLVRYEKLERRHAVIIASQVLMALEVAHAEEIVHRDVKPENIFLTIGPQGETHVKIVDFGISKAINPEKNFVGSITQINTTVGTPHYMSPEQAKGEPIDPRSDLWALGVVLYESLTGHLPFDGDNFNTQIVAVVTEPHVPATTYGVDADLSAIIDRCLQKDRARRYRDAGEMLAALHAYAAKHPELGISDAAGESEPNTAEWRAATASSRPGTIPPVESMRLTSNDTLEQAPVFPGMVRIDEEPQADSAPTTVRGLDRSLVRPATGRGLEPELLSVPPVEAPAAPKPALLVGLALLTALVTGGTTFAVYERFRPPAASNAVRVQFVGLRGDARVCLASLPCQESATVFISKTAVDMPVRVIADGYRTMEFRIRPDHDQNVALPSMEPAPAPAAAPDASAFPAAPLAVDASTRAREEAHVAPPAPATVPAAPAVVAPAVAAHAPVAPAHPAAARPAGNTFLTVGGSGCQVYIDGTLIRAAPVVNHPVAPGQHSVGCLREGRMMRQTLDVPAGQTTRQVF